MDQSLVDAMTLWGLITAFIISLYRYILPGIKKSEALVQAEKYTVVGKGFFEYAFVVC